jgi:hypothetical protein
MQLLALLVTAITTLDSTGRPSLMPATAHAAEKVALMSGSVTIVGPSTAVPAQPKLDVLSEAVTKKLGSMMLYMPAGLSMPKDGSYDLIVHFHGGSQIMNPQVDGTNFVLVTVNLGIGSGVYNDRFAAPQALEQLLSTIDRAVAESGPTRTAKRRHLALSAWSAGYGALQQLLSHEQNLAHIDGLYLLDGLHASLDPNTRKRAVFPASLDAFVRYARLAARGEKRMLVTHSAIETYDYASTTESARYLVNELGLPACKDAPEPGAMRATQCHRRGELRVNGYAGNDAPAHCQHVRQWKSLVVEPLAAAWSPKSPKPSARLTARAHASTML